MRKRFWLAVAAYLVPTFILGYVWHLVLFAERYEALGLYRDEVIIPLGLSSMLVQAVVFAWAYPRLFSRRGADWLASAAAFGSVLAVLSWSFTTLPVAAKYQMASVPGFLVLETSFTLAQFLLVAPLIALAYRGAAEPSLQAEIPGGRAVQSPAG